ncbi:MAG: hypothetical protein IEMM0008_1320 [bacterium]|nr:MAG: hypothetical protein IEMM0008_1320 [bacterium]
MQRIKISLFIFIAILVSNGTYANNKHLILSTSKATPRWIHKANVIKDRGGNLYFRGQAMSRSRKIALTMARANAQVLAARYFHLTIGGIYNYKGDLKKKAEGVRVSTTRIVYIRGLLPVDSYIEEIAVLKIYSKDNYVVESLIYRAYFQMKIDKNMLKYIKLKSK